MIYTDRRDFVVAQLFSLDIDAFFSTCIENVSYLSGFSGSSGAILFTEKKKFFLTDSRYTEQANKEVYGLEIVETKNSIREIQKLLSSENIKRAGFEAQHLSYADYKLVRNGLQQTTLKSTTDLVEVGRMVKSDAEITKVKSAVQVAQDALEATVDKVVAGISEKDVAVELQYALLKSGGDGIAFDIIVASGERGALPHGIASEKVIENGDLVIIDFGARLNGYHSDCTRTIAVGEPDKRKNEIYNVVLSAQLSSINAVKKGVLADSVDKAARVMIHDAGYGDNFGHGTGHGIGLDVHEPPYIKPKQETVLKPGMVFTIEPGIYIPGFAGVRIEDMVVVTENGCEVLTSGIPKQGISG